MHSLVKLVMISMAMLFLVGVMESGAADASENKAKETGKQMWETLKKDVKEVKAAVKEQGKKASEGAKRNLKEAKETFVPVKKKTDSAQKDKP